MTKIDFTNVGKTALLVAHFRAYTRNPVTRRIAKESNASETAKEFFDSAGDMKRAAAWLPLMLEVRTRGLTEIVKDRVAKGTRAVVEIGAGVAVERALEISEDPEVHYALTDYNHELVALQTRIVGKELGHLRRNLDYICIDALNAGENHAICNLMGTSFDKVIEGVMPYFDMAQKKNFWKVSRETMSPGSAVLTTDILTKPRLKFLLANQPERYRLLEKLSGISGHSMIENAYTDENEPLEMAREAGFKAHYEPLFEGRGYELTSPGIIEAIEGVKPSPEDIARFSERRALVAVKR